LYGAVSGLEWFETPLMGKTFKGHSKAGVLTGGTFSSSQEAGPCVTVS